jgi:uncharacterized secreted protein with C-terminal beta-propeller domain
MNMKKFIVSFLAVFTMIIFVACESKPLQIPTGDNVGSFASYEQLGEYLKQFYEEQDNQIYYFGGMLEDSAEVLAPTNGIDLESEKSTRDYSKVNSQVEGVEESDTLLTDGYYIYIASGNKFFMIDAETLSIVYTYEFIEGYLEGLYLYEDSVVLFGSYYHYEEQIIEEENPDETTEEGVVSEDYKADYYYPYFRYIYGSKVIVLDKSDPENVEVTRELVFDSSYIASTRMINGYLYLIMNNYQISYYYQEEDFVPKIMDSVIHDELEQLPANQIFFMPNDGENFSYLILASFKVNDDETASVKAYLGSTYQIFMSQNNLYTTVYKYRYNEVDKTYEDQTFIMRFAIEDNELAYKAIGEISGMPLNQFSMDEYDGVFRIAVTDYDYNGMETVITNTLYLLDATTDDTMTKISELGGLGKPGERIYAVRYSGAEAYVVTFVNTDPLYKLDLSDPENPSVLGELYEEGVSDYLHEITEGLMIGVGRQAETNTYGQTVFTGVKIALYDTTGDDPVNLETYLVEGQYSYSRVTYDHKAFVYFAPEGEDFAYIAVPVSIYSDNYYRYSQKMFVFKVYYSGDLELVAELEHMTSDSSYFDTIEKAVMIENYIYTLSYSQLQVFNMESDFEFVDGVVYNEVYYRDYFYTEEPVASDDQIG